MITKFEEEPRLKYSAISCKSILLKDSATKLCVSDKVLALGTSNGAVFLLDYDGNQVGGHQKLHSQPITDLSFDTSTEFIASSSSDKSVVLHNILTTQTEVFKFSSPITTITLDPRYGSRKTQELIVGSSQGTLSLSSRGWLGVKENLLFHGKGPLLITRMSGTLLAWASLSGGVRVYDTADHVRIAKLDKSRWKLGSSSEGNMSPKCCLIWNRVATGTGTYGHELMVGWGRHVLVARVVSCTTHGGGMDQHSPSSSPHKQQQQQPSPPPSVVSNTTTTSSITTTTTTTTTSKVLQTIAEFDVPFDIAGIAPFGTDIALLAASSSSSSSSTNNNISLKIYDTTGHQLFSDSLDDLLDSHLQDDDRVSLESYNPPVFSPLHNNDNYDGGASSTGSRSFKWWKDGEEPMYFIYTPRHIILGRPRDGNDRIIWLCEKGRYKEAIEVAEEDPTVRPECAFQLGEEYLGYLMDGNGGGQGGGKKEYEAAAVLVPWIVERLLKSKSIQGEDGTAAAVAYWERVVYMFAQVRALGALADVLPSMQQMTMVEGEEEGGRRTTTSGEVGPPLLPHTSTSLQHQHHQIRLNTETYNMVLNSFVLLQSDHPRLLKAVKTWPPHLYDRDELLYMCQQRRLGTSPRKGKQAAAKKKNTGTATTTAASSQPQVLVKSPALLETIAELLNNKGDYISALAVYVDVKHPDTFDYIEQHGLWTAAAQYAADLILIDRGRAVDMLAQHADEASPSVVVSKLMSSRPPSLSLSASLGVDDNNYNSKASTNGITSTATSATTPLPPSYEEDEDTYARYVTHTYLSALFLHSPSSIDQFAELQLHLHAEFDPSKLLSFLDACTACPLDAALKVCQSKGLVRESVFVLGRMGATDKALRLMVEQLRDVRGAVDFAASQQEHSMGSSYSTNDDDLWELLITLALSDAELAGSLMDHSGGHIDPLKIIQRIPDHMAIERLRQRLVTLIHDHRSSSVLHEGAAAVLAADCAGLARRLYRELKAALRRVVQQLANDEAVSIGYKSDSAYTGSSPNTNKPIGYNDKSPRRVMAASAAVDRNASPPPRPPSSTITMSSPSKFSPMKNKWTVQQHA